MIIHLVFLERYDGVILRNGKRYMRYAATEDCRRYTVCRKKAVDVLIEQDSI